jgi:hypothetical protein
LLLLRRKLNVTIPRRVGFAVVEAYRFIDCARAAIVQERAASTQSPERRGSHFIRLRGSLGDSIP